MLKKFLCIIFLLKFLEGFMIEENHVCSLLGTSMHCKCQKRENITLTSSVHFDLRNIKIEGCGAVSVPLGSIPHLQLQEISFIDINELYILPFSLVGIQALHTLMIRDVRKFSVAPHGFVGLMNVENVVIKNVVSKQLIEASFGGVTTVENFRIEDSEFGDVEDNAFILSNITSLSIVNCTFETMDSNSFLIHNAKVVYLSNCDTQNASYDSIHLSSVDSVKFHDCFFGVLEPHFVHATDVKNFEFEGCIVHELKSFAFASLEVSKEITFINNIFTFADEHSLYFKTENASEDLFIIDCCNHFTCDCNIYWLWEKNYSISYQSVLESYCIGEDYVYLKDMVPVKDSHNNCKTFEMKPVTASDSTDYYEFTHDGEISSPAVMLLSTFSCLIFCFLFFGFACLL